MIIKCKANEREFEVDGKVLTNDVAPFELSDRTFVPIRFIAENMGLHVGYNVKNGTVTIENRKRYFDTLDECAVDFGTYANCASIALYREIGAFAFESADGYYWDGLKIGEKDMQNIVIDASLARKCAAILHTHGGTAGSAANNHFSTGDKKAAAKYDKPIYLCSPVGEIWRHNPHGESGKRQICVGYAPIDWKFEKICTELGKRDYKTAKDDFLKYFGGRYRSIADDFDKGYVLDFYNRMFLSGDLY